VGHSEDIFPQLRIFSRTTIKWGFGGSFRPGRRDELITHTQCHCRVAQIPCKSHSLDNPVVDSHNVAPLRLHHDYVNLLTMPRSFLIRRSETGAGKAEMSGVLREDSTLAPSTIDHAGWTWLFPISERKRNAIHCESCEWYIVLFFTCEDPSRVLFLSCGPHRQRRMSGSRLQVLACMFTARAPATVKIRAPRQPKIEFAERSTMPQQLAP